MGSFDLINLFQQQFGNRAKEFSFSELPVAGKTARRGTDLYDNDVFGREFFMPIWLGQDEQSLVSLPYSIIRVESKKHIVETPLTERTGTVKELVTIENYKFSVKGLLISSDGSWPEEQIDKINTLYRIVKPLIIKSALTDIFLLTPERGGHDKVVMSELKLHEGKGAINVRSFEMELISDEEFNLEEISNVQTGK